MNFLVDWVVFPGVARLRGMSLHLERSEARPDVEILPEWYKRIRRFDDKGRRILQRAEYFLALSVPGLQDGEGEDREPTGSSG